MTSALGARPIDGSRRGPWIWSRLSWTDPFAGIGKPEPLKYLAPNAGRARLTQEHRVVYLVKENRVEFLQARYHYG